MAERRGARRRHDVDRQRAAHASGRPPGHRENEGDRHGRAPASGGQPTPKSANETNSPVVTTSSRPQLSAEAIVARSRAPGTCSRRKSQIDHGGVGGQTAHVNWSPPSARRGPRSRPSSTHASYATALQRRQSFRQRPSLPTSSSVGNVMPKDMEAATEAVRTWRRPRRPDRDPTMMVARAEGNAPPSKSPACNRRHESEGGEGSHRAPIRSTRNLAAGGSVGRHIGLSSSRAPDSSTPPSARTRKTRPSSAIGALNQMIRTNTGELNSNATANALVSGAVIARPDLPSARRDRPQRSRPAPASDREP